MEYSAAPSFPRLHTFEMEEYVAGWVFASEDDASEVVKLVSAGIPRASNRPGGPAAAAPSNSSNSMDGDTPTSTTSQRKESKGLASKFMGLFRRSKKAESPSVEVPQPKAAPPPSRPPRDSVPAPVISAAAVSSAHTAGDAGSDSRPRAQSGSDEWLRVLQHAGFSKKQLLNPAVVKALADIVSLEGINLPAAGTVDSATDDTGPARPASVRVGGTPAAEQDTTTSKAPLRRRASSRRSISQQASAGGEPGADPAAGAPLLRRRSSTKLLSPGEKILKDVQQDINPILAARKMEIVRALGMLSEQGGFNLRPVQVRFAFCYLVRPLTAYKHAALLSCRKEQIQVLRPSQLRIRK